VDQDAVRAFGGLPVDSDPDRFWIVSVVPEPKRGQGFVAVVLTKDLGGQVSDAAATPGEALEILAGLLVEFARSTGVRPGTIATTDPTYGLRLRRELGGAVSGTEILVVPHLPPLAAILDELAVDAGSAMRAGPLAGEGMTVERLRSFAEAARDFYRSAPWNHLDGDDLIQIESPKSSGGQKYVVVMGSGGETFGLAFYKSAARYRRTLAAEPPDLSGRPDRLMAVVFWGPQGVWPADVAVWREHGLPLAGPEAYPVAAFQDYSSGEKFRAGAEMVAHAEGLLRALAATTEEELDAGRWTKRVMTADGEREYTLALPDLLKAMVNPKRARISPERPDAIRRVLERAMAQLDPARAAVEDVNAPLDPNDPEAAKRRAMDLLDRAVEARGRRRIQLARLALKLDPDAADAWNTIAGGRGDPQYRAALYEKGLEAGRRALGDQFDELAGQFWGFLETRPYMRARVGLAMALREMGRYGEALGHLQEMLRLNPDDNQGVRDLIPHILLAVGRDREVLEHVARRGDDYAIAAYARALALFRLEGVSETARGALSHAVVVNPHFAHHLSRGTWPVAEGPYGWSPGEPSEAVYALEELAEAWHATPGAVRWLAAAAPPPAARRGRRRRRGG
jgi:tetratricopeptide (TPR) repeat protein